MKKILSRSLSCLLAILLMMSTTFSSVVFAANGMNAEQAESPASELTIESDVRKAQPKNVPDHKMKTEITVEETGSGTPEDPKVKTTTKKTDNENEETTTTVEKEKEWKDENTEGEEKSKTQEIVDAQENLIGESGVAEGKETTTLKDTEETVTEEATIEHGEATTEDGKKIESEEPEVTVTLTPGEMDEETEEMNAWFNEDTLNIPDWIRQKDGETATWITENTSKEENGSVTNVTVEKTENSTTYVRKITKPDGRVTEEKITYIRDQKNRITGYDTESKEILSETTEEMTPPQNAEIHADGGWKELVYELPDKPETEEEPEKDEDGHVINGTVVAEIRDQEGNVAGYTKVEIKDGKIVKYSDPIMGKLISIETKVEKLENGLKKYTSTKTTLTRTRAKKSSGSISDAMRIVHGEMGPINGSVVFDYNSLKTFLPDFTIAGPDGTGFNEENDVAKVDSNFVKDYDENGKYFQWLGQLGLFSLIYIRDGDGDVVSADQFEILGKDGRKYYAYCADLGVYAQEGAQYNMQRIEDADYIQHKDKLRSIVLKGYWGVKNESEDANHPSAGSLDAFRKMLLDNHALTEEESNGLTDGMALLATQAAIWRYGNSGQNKLGEELQFPWSPGEPKTTIMNKTYQYLIGMEGTPANASNTVFNKDDFAQMVNITVKEKLEDEKYNTDVRIAMAVKFDDETSDLKLYVTADGEKVDEYRLTGALQEGEKKASKNPDGTYTLSGLCLKGGAKFKIHLKGVQNLKDGVYIFSCNEGPNGSPAQTFVGAGESRQDIDLNADLLFQEEEKVTYSAVKSENEAKTLAWQASYFTFEETSYHEDEVESETTDNDELELPEEVDHDIEKTQEGITEEERKEKPEKAEKEVTIEVIKGSAEETTGEDGDRWAPKTGDKRFAIQMNLLLSALISSIAAAFFIIKKNKANESAKRSH